MDKEQAIDLLDNLIGMVEDNQENDYDTAFRMAIDALKAQLSQEGTTFAPNNQVNLCDSCTYTYPECPSEKDDVIFGNGIGNDNICACNKYQPTVQPVATDTNVGDTISRQAAIDALDCINGIEEVLRSLPSAQPEPKTGNWIGTEFDGYADGNPVFYEWQCSECGCIFEDEEPTYKFCPNCGAKMKGAQNG